MIKNKKLLLGLAILAVLIVPLVLGIRGKTAYVDNPSSPLIPLLLTDSDFKDELMLYRFLIYDEVLYQQTTIETGIEPQMLKETATRTFLGNFGWDRIGVFHTIKCLDGDSSEVVGSNDEQRLDIKFDISMYGDRQDSICFLSDRSMICFVNVRYSKILSILRVIGPPSISTDKLKLFIEKLSVQIDEKIITSNVCD
jgi:hypothetical protein